MQLKTGLCVIATFVAIYFFFTAKNWKLGILAVASAIVISRTES